jgi:O-antigen/teichoic acid export membrane protein
VSQPPAGQRGSYSRGLGYGALSFVAMAILGVVSSVVIARVYGVQVVGEFALASAPAMALWFLSTVKEQTAMVRELTRLPPRAPRVTGLFVAVFTFSMALTLLVAIVLGVGAYFVLRGPIGRPDLFLPAVVSLAGYSLVTNVGWNVDGVFAAFVAGRELFWIRLHETVAFPVLAIAIGVAYPSVWGLIAATYGAPVTATIHRAITVRRYMRYRVARDEIRAGFRILPELLRFAVRMAPGTVLDGTTTQTATWTLGVMSTVPVVGAFNRAQVLVGRFQDLNMKITEMLFPTLVARRGEGDDAGFNHAFWETLRYAFVFMAMLWAVGGGGAEAVMSLFGEGFVTASGAFAILLGLPALNCGALIQTHALYAVDRPGVPSWVALARLICTVAVTIPATLVFGIEGPAVGLLSGAVLDVTLKHWIVRGYVSTLSSDHWSRREMLALVIACASGWVTAAAASARLPQPIGLPVVLLAGAAAYWAAFWAAGGVNRRDRLRVRTLAQKMAPTMAERIFARGDGAR